MHTNFRKILIPILVLAAATLACNQVTGATPQPAATLNALYTSAAQTLEGMSTQAAIATQTSPTATLSCKRQSISRRSVSAPR